MHISFFNLISLVVLAACANVSNAVAQSSPLNAADLAQFADLIDRTYKTPLEDKENIILDRRVRIRNFPGDGIWFYTQMNTGEGGKLYRQRLSQLSLSPDRNAIIQKGYGLTEPSKYTDSWNDPNLLESLSAGDFKPYFDQGCDQQWTKQSDGSWSGYVNPKACTIFSKRRNMRIGIESEARLSATKYQTNERGFDMDGQQLWGTKPREFISLYPVPTESAGRNISLLLTGIYSNEEQVYFEKDAGREAPPWLSVTIKQTAAGMELRQIDAFGKDVAPAKSITFSDNGDKAVLTVENCSRFFERDGVGWKYSDIQNGKRCRQPFQISHIGGDGLSVRFSSGKESNLKRARAVQCWAAVPKEQPKPDGTTDWLFERKLNLHDQGGRTTVGGGDSGAEAVTLRMRAVHWPPPSTNRPSMVLYIHKDDPDSAASYSWADINASRVGINLRWMQASCTIEGAEQSSRVNKQNFRG